MNIQVIERENPTNKKKTQKKKNYNNIFTKLHSLKNLRKSLNDDVG